MSLHALTKDFLLRMLGYRQKRIIRSIRYKLRRKLSPDSAEALKNMNALIASRPVKIILETYSLCNSRCVFCARRKLKASRQLMSLELFEKVCNEYTGIGGGFLGFSPLLSDPLLDPLLLERIRIVHGQFANIYLHMFTNGIAFTNFSDEEMIEILTALDHMDISIGGLNRTDYKIMFGVDQFEKVKKTLFRLNDLNNRFACNCKLGLHIRTHKKQMVVNSPELRELINLGYKCNDILDYFSDWGGLVTAEDLPEGANLIKQDNTGCKVPCLIPIIYMMIMPDGRVLGCACMDGKEDTYVGHLATSSLQEIWQGKEFRDLRNSFLEGKLYALCRTCSFYREYEDFFCRPGLKDFDPSKNFWDCV